MAAILSATEISLSFGNRKILDEATFAIEEKEKVGVVGRNGVGKSCLLRMLGGDEVPDSGTISFKRDLRVGYLPQEFTVDESLNVVENVRTGLADVFEMIQRYETSEGSETELAELLHSIEARDGWNAEVRIQAAMHALGLPPADQSVVGLSGGEKRRIALCRAIVSQPDLLILDEPTNHLDADSIIWLETFLMQSSASVIFVTHDRYFLERVANNILEVANQKIFLHPGNYSAYLEAKESRRLVAEKTEARRQKFLRSELEWVRSGVKARTTKSRHRLEQFHAIADQDAPQEEKEIDLLLPPAPQLGNVVVELKDAGVKINDRWLFRHLDLNFEPGTVTGIIGRNGQGKTSLLRVLLGESSPTEGTVTIGKRTVFNYIDQTRVTLNNNNTVLKEIEDQDETVRFGNSTLSVRAYLKRFLFTDDRINDRVDRLSGGERARLLLAKVLKRGGNFIILDEPTNDLDLQTLRILENTLIDFEGAAVVVSHDRYFLDRICDRIIAFEGTPELYIQPGNFSYYQEKREERENTKSSSPSSPTPSAPPTPATPSPAPASDTTSTPPRKLKWKEERELESIEPLILEKESEADQLEANLNDPEFYRTHAQNIQEFTQQLQSLRNEISKLYDRWAELETIRDTSTK